MAGKYLLSVVIGCLFTISSSSFLFSTLDTRYPTVITRHPGVNCREEGSFPHPADCTWYYRCVDKTSYGFFQVYFFKCEPGTVFADNLDQCVYGDPSTCSGNLGNTVQGPWIPAKPTGPEPTGPAPGTSQPSGQVGTPDSGATGTSSTTPFETPLVTTTTTEEETTMEPTTTPNPDISPSGPEPDVSPPGIKPDISSPAPPPTITDPATDESSTIICNDCREKTVCKVGSKPYLVSVCQSCKFPSTQDFVTPQEECPYHPNPHLTSEGRCLAGQDLCPEKPRSNQSDQPQSEEPLYTIQCSDKKVRPDDPKIRNLFCKTYHFCSPFGSYQGTKILCSNFFQCYKTTEGYWTAELRNCIGNNLYSFDLDQCMAKPRELDLCEKR